MVEEFEKKIAESVHRIMESLPPEVTLVAAVKGRSVAEVRAAIEAGVTHVGHNYIQEAELMVDLMRDSAKWHMIGHLQRNKAKKAVRLFDKVETVDSWHLARELDKRCARMAKTMPVLIEVNSGREASKTGVMPEDVEGLVWHMRELEHLRVQGLMTMGPRFGDPEHARPFFQETRKAFDRLARMDLPHVSMHYLSMGMTNSYRVAIEEGANVVRIGTKIFGQRGSEG
ncbi:MAG: YggS family pyridoxal phosphate-dependent enzyme [Anaerolineales bacterium]|nr:MAG: YggS family pyridoxal phosphate-dependent enzyme [Anaerolineales bacterium]